MRWLVMGGVAFEICTVDSKVYVLLIVISKFQANALYVCIG